MSASIRPPQRSEVASAKPVKGYDSVDVLRIDAS